MTPRAQGRAAGALVIALAAATLTAATLAAATVGAGPAWAAERPDRYLGPARKVAVLVFPLETILGATTQEPLLAVEVRIDLGAGLALAIRPIGVWYVKGGVSDAHGGGVGGALALHWYLQRALAGPFLALQGGDIEAFVGGERGRTVGGSAIFGYAWSLRSKGRSSGPLFSVGLGLGYWHRMGVVDTGPVWPEILSLRFGAGWGW